MAMPTDDVYLPPAIPWPYDDDQGSRERPWYRKPEVIAMSALSLLATVALVIAIVLYANSTQSTTSADESPVPTTVAAPAPTPTRSPEAERRRAEQASRLDPSTYQSITPREFALLVKNPDAAAGRKVIVYGVVTQFDAATGSSAFRADTGATPQDSTYEYDQNSFIQARDPSILANVVEDDVITMYVEVGGSYTYDTQIGGTMTVPMFWVNIVKVTNSGAGPAPAPSARPLPVPVPRTATPMPADLESASLAQLRTIANEDRAFVTAQLTDRWIPQLSSKRPGLVAEGITWNNATTLREHLQLRQQFPGVRLLRSGDWSTFSAPDFWVTVAGVSFPDAGGALAWCTGNGLDRDHCYAKIVSTTHPVDGSTAFN